MNCKHCNKEFEPTNKGRQMFCSVKCGFEHRKTKNPPCKICGGETGYNAKDHSGICITCFREIKAKESYNKMIEALKGRTCKCCGVELTVIADRIANKETSYKEFKTRVYCSNKCKRIYEREHKGRRRYVTDLREDIVELTIEQIQQCKVELEKRIKVDYVRRGLTLSALCPVRGEYYAEHN
jgi:hypothetical protein